MTTFLNLPVNTIRVPGNYFEINSQNANTAQSNTRALIVAQMTASGTATPNVPIITTGVGASATLFGQGSMAHIMVNRFRLNNTFTELWVLPLSDNVAATAGFGTITITGPCTNAGTLNVYIAGNLIQVACNVNDTATIMASNLVTAIGQNVLSPVTAVSSAGVVTITAKNKGLAASDIDIRFNYAGAIGGQTFPTGVNATSTWTYGTADPITDTALGNCNAYKFDYFVYPYTASTQMTSIETYLSDLTGTWSWQEKKFGHSFGAYRGTLASLTTYGATNNNQHTTVFGFYDSPRACYDIASAVVAAASTSLAIDPAVPLQNLLVDVLAPPVASRFTISENNTLLYDGISTFKYNTAGQAMIQRAVTTYDYNSYGDPDNSYLDVETMYTLAYVINYINTDLDTKFARFKLVADGSQIPAGSNCTTSQLVLGEVIACYRALAAQNEVQNPDVFAAQATAYNAGNGTVVMNLPIQIANQLRITASLYQFTKP